MFWLLHLDKARGRDKYVHVVQCTVDVQFHSMVSRAEEPRLSDDLVSSSSCLAPQHRCKRAIQSWCQDSKQFGVVKERHEQGWYGEEVSVGQSVADSRVVPRQCETLAGTSLGGKNSVARKIVEHESLFYWSLCVSIDGYQNQNENHSKALRTGLKPKVVVKDLRLCRNKNNNLQ